MLNRPRLQALLVLIEVTEAQPHPVGDRNEILLPLVEGERVLVIFLIVLPHNINKLYLIPNRYIQAESGLRTNLYMTPLSPPTTNYFYEIARIALRGYPGLNYGTL